jgi:predicted RNase H-like nuclease
MKFIGIDLGWTSGASGLCCLVWQDSCLKILDLTIHLETEKILAWLDRWTLDEPALVAVDAPTLIPNQTGMRLPDKLAHKHFHQYHAGCYPANASLSFAKRTIDFGLSLEKRNFQHADTIEPQKLGRYQIEVFPHPATVNLFNLDRILKYKKGKLANKKIELIKLQNYIVSVLPKLEPSLQLETQFDINDLTTGAQLKAIEDKLDSLMCAYIGAYWWYWGMQRNLVLGDKTTGYIVIPLLISGT